MTTTTLSNFTTNAAMHTSASKPYSSRGTVWFPGLNALRFFAAALVVIMHTHNNMQVAGLPQLPAFPVLFKGLAAVSFFFVLSGFLITWLLLQEWTNYKTINIKKFYLRRVFRIWPLYVLVIAGGMLFYWVLVPRLQLHFDTSYPHSVAILLYSFFLANLMNSLYHVGGILHVTWSIAVEEQFYLFWAPIVKRFRKNIPEVIAVVVVISLSIHIVNGINGFNVSKNWQAFINTLQFHYMAMGAGFAWLLSCQKTWLLNLSIFKKKTWQLLPLAVLLVYLFFYTKTAAVELIMPLPLGLTFGWLIVNVACNPNKLFSLNNAVLNYLGKISYGIYMFHMPVVYATSFLFQHAQPILSPAIYFPLFFVMVMGITIGVATLSYYCLEAPILNYTRRFSQSNPIQ